MSAYPELINETQRAYCLLLSWLETTMDDVFFMEADHDKGLTLLAGDPDKIDEFKARLGAYIDKFLKDEEHESGRL